MTSAANPTLLFGYAAAAGLAYVWWRQRKPPRQIAVLGSTNPGKLDACQRGVDAWSPNFRFTFIGVNTDSGVSEQPVGLDETLLGARNRAAGALRAVAGASIGVGLESGVLQVEGALFDVCACAIFDGTYMCVGLSSSWPLPPRVALELDRLGYNAAFEAVTAAPADADGAGALSQLSDGVLSRPAQMQEALNVCLLQLRNPQLYGPASGRPYSPIWENSGETPERVRRNSGAEETPDSLRKF